MSLTHGSLVRAVPRGIWEVGSGLEGGGGQYDHQQRARRSRGGGGGGGWSLVKVRGQKPSGPGEQDNYQPGLAREPRGGQLDCSTLRSVRFSTLCYEFTPLR